MCQWGWRRKELPFAKPQEISAFPKHWKLESPYPEEAAWLHKSRWWPQLQFYDSSGRNRASWPFPPNESYLSHPDSMLTSFYLLQVMPSRCVCLSLPRMGQQWKPPSFTDRMQLVRPNLLRLMNLQTENASNRFPPKSSETRPFCSKPPMHAFESPGTQSTPLPTSLLLSWTSWGLGVHV